MLRRSLFFSFFFNFFSQCLWELTSFIENNLKIIAKKFGRMK